MSKTLDDLELPNFTPIWATNDMSLVTENVSLYIDANIQQSMWELYGGAKSSDCSNLCTTTKTCTKLVANTQRDDV